MITNFTCVSINSVPTPAQLIQKMLNSTVDNILYVYGFPYDENDESDYIYRCRMNWTKTTINEFISNLRNCDFLINNGAPFAEDVTIRRNRLQRLKEIHASEIVIQNEYKLLMLAATLNQFSSDLEIIHIPMNDETKKEVSYD